LKKVFDKLQPKNNYVDLQKEFGTLPFEKEYFTSYSKNKDGSNTKKTTM